MLAETHLVTPPGFHSTCEILNIIPQQIVSEMILSIVMNPHTTGSSFYKLYTQHPEYNTISISSTTLSTPQFDAALNAIQYIHQTMAKCGDVFSIPSEDIAGFLRKQTTLSTETIQTFITSYQSIIDSQKTQDHQHISSQIATAFSLGKIIGIEWKLGVAVSSDQCDELAAPFITIVFKIADTDGFKSHPVEMTISQFKMFKTSLIELSHSFEDAV